MTNRDRDLGSALTQFPTEFMEPVFIGDPPLSKIHPRCASGTAALMRLGKKYLALTCQHVLQAYRDLAGRPRHFQIGHLSLDPESQLLSEDKRLDLAVIELHSDQLLDIGKDTGIPESRFFGPRSWPPDPFQHDDVISFAGFPGEWREQAGLRSFDTYMFSHGAALVHSVSGSHFVTRLELDRVETYFGMMDLPNIAGMSGGPVFRWRRTSLEPQLVGIIFEYQDSFDLLYARCTSVIPADGQLDQGAL